ncbi:DUF7002 family protein [Mariluticola halotolerans]|uniref:DUF7002 family protein n=1 Tax=Mariluticola halotolerans TaxID=2909283 RepID=UPI0026E3330E|nr:hypothetical protein [Mariluticola halotolerans]UJQ94153.1 hypothetical protein L1P08_14515 [Mariluticola halotolerans]
MTEGELEELVADCPTLYHMAERGSWPSIKKYGLLSTSALLDQYAIEPPRRTEIESRHRPESVEVIGEGLPRAVVRDQIPMSDSGLRRALPARLSPSDWYELLNAKAFFWLSEKRLHKLTSAKAYRDQEHDVLEIDTRSLIDAHRDSIWLCPINSGCTKPMPHPRDESIFSRISDYPYAHWRERRGRQERVVELAVDHSIDDIREHVRRVVVKRGTEVLSVLE